MNELRRWHSSKANILQIKIRDTVKVIVELEKKKREMLNSLKLKTDQTRDKASLADRVEVKVYKALQKDQSPVINEDPPKQNALSVGDLEMSPSANDGPNFIVKDGEFFGDHKDQLPKYFNVLNEDGIEKKTFYQDEISNIAEARSLLKALDRGDDFEHGRQKSMLGNTPILDGLSSSIIPSA